MTGREFRDWAVKYRDIGISPIPLYGPSYAETLGSKRKTIDETDRGKPPVIPWTEFRDRLPSESEIGSWASRLRDFNLGLVMGRKLEIDGDERFLFVIDFDYRDDTPKDPVTEILQSLSQHGIEIDMSTPIVRTLRGAHFYFTSPVQVMSKTGWAHKLGRFGVDTKGEVGYVVAPPSTRISGFRYSWVTGLDIACIPEAPEALFRIVTQRIYESTNGAYKPMPRHWREKLERGPIEESGDPPRDKSCFALAREYLAEGVDYEVVVRTLQEWNRRVCRPPLHDDVVQQKCVSARRGLKHRPPEPIAPPAEKALDGAPFAAGLDRLALATREPITNRIKTPWSRINGIFPGGLRRRGFYVIAAADGAGKTSLCCQLAYYCSLETPVLYASAEMSADDLKRRIISQRYMVPFEELDEGSMSDRAFVAIKRAAEESTRARLFFFDQARDFAQIEKVARSMADPPGLIVIDYLQLLDAKAESQRLRIEKISAELRDGARDMGCAIVAASSVSETSDGKVEVRETRQIGYDATGLIILDRKPDSTGDTNVIVKKNRFGPKTGTSIWFDYRTMRYFDTYTDADADIAKSPDFEEKEFNPDALD